MQLTQSSVGRKIIMAVTGFVLVAFRLRAPARATRPCLFGADAINAYAQKLHSLGPFVWVFRLVMLAAFALHIIFGIQLTLENRAATPEKNVQVKRLKTGFGAETMIVSGLVMLAFVVYHLLHFTVRVTNPDIYVPLGIMAWSMSITWWSRVQERSAGDHLPGRHGSSCSCTSVTASKACSRLWD